MPAGPGLMICGLTVAGEQLNVIQASKALLRLNSCKVVADAGRRMPRPLADPVLCHCSGQIRIVL